MKITSNLDPISLNDAPTDDPRLHLHDRDLDIYFESTENLETYRNMHIERHGLDFEHIWDNPTDDLGADWN